MSHGATIAHINGVDGPTLLGCTVSDRCVGRAQPFAPTTQRSAKRAPQQINHQTYSSSASRKRLVSHGVCKKMAKSCCNTGVVVISWCAKSCAQLCSAPTQCDNPGVAKMPVQVRMRSCVGVCVCGFFGALRLLKVSRGCRCTPSTSSGGSSQAGARWPASSTSSLSSAPASCRCTSRGPPTVSSAPSRNAPNAVCAALRHAAAAAFPPRTCSVLDQGNRAMGAARHRVPQRAHRRGVGAEGVGQCASRRSGGAGSTVARHTLLARPGHVAQLSNTRVPCPFGALQTFYRLWTTSPAANDLIGKPAAMTPVVKVSRALGPAVAASCCSAGHRQRRICLSPLRLTTTHRQCPARPPRAVLDVRFQPGRPP